MSRIPGALRRVEKQLESKVQTIGIAAPQQHAGASSPETPRDADEPSAVESVASELLLTLCGRQSSIAVFGVHGSGTRGCEQVAVALSALNRRVIIVSVLALLDADLDVHPQMTGVVLGDTGKFWVWPPGPSYALDGFKREAVRSEADWLNSLRRNFDYVLLECPDLQVTPRCARIAALADLALLAVERGRISKRNVLEARRMIQSTGLRFAGSLLIDSRYAR